MNCPALGTNGCNLPRYPGSLEYSRRFWRNRKASVVRYGVPGNKISRRKAGYFIK
jgi:hypothetical protein